MSAAPVQAPGARAPRLSGGWPLVGHLLEFRKDPLGLMERVRAECGDAGTFQLAGHRITLLTGARAQEAFFRAPDEQLDQAAAYPFMTPIFGEGVVFDATPEQRKQAMKNQSLRDQFMRGHAEMIAAEVEAMTAGWGEQGEIDLLDFMAELTIYTSSTALIGRQFREALDGSYVRIFMELERGTDALAYVNPNLPIPSLRTRDRARRELVGKIEAIFEARDRDDVEYKDLFQVLRRLRDEQGERRYSDDQITGMFISMMFAGHHTTSVSGSWSLIELLRHRDWLQKVVAELDEIFADGRDVSYQALREIPLLECALKESLRLHPPLVILMRKVVHDFHHDDLTVPAGELVATSPAVSNRMPEHFPEPDRYLPERYLPGRDEDRQPFAWIPFGAGRHRCVGAAFAMMQLKAIFSSLLRRFEFELAQPAESYANDLTKMVVAVQQPCRIRYRRRVVASAAAAQAASAAGAGPRAEGAFRVCLDRDLCQGHAVCVSEAPEVFELDPAENKVVVRTQTPDPALRPKVELAVQHCPTRALSIEEP